MPSSFAGGIFSDDELAAVLSRKEPLRIHVDLTEVRFARPSGLAYLYVLVYSLMRRGHFMSLSQPKDDACQAYIRRTNFWTLLGEHGFRVPDDWHGYNVGRAPGLIECSLIQTNEDIESNMRSSVLSYDRVRRALRRGDATGHDRVASVFAELAGNAAEHSRSARGAFVAAQAYPKLGEVEIVVADVGVGIRIALATPGLNDVQSIEAALEEGTTGRRDASGRPLEGGFGLPTAREESATLTIRSVRVWSPAGQSLERSRGKKYHPERRFVGRNPCHR
jgi:anti-sigma regulatory factor (Ser/Thr protein kinase)